MFISVQTSWAGCESHTLAPSSLAQKDHDAAPSNVELLEGQPIYVDVSDTFALSPLGTEQFSPHEIALMHLVNEDPLIFPQGKEFQRGNFIAECEEGYAEFMRIRRDQTIPIAQRYEPLLEPFVGKLHRRHFEQWVSEWRFNSRFLDGVKLLRDTLDLPRDYPFEIASGNLVPINRAFMERPDVAAILKTHGINFAVIQGVDLEFDAAGFFTGKVDVVGSLFYANADQYPKNCFVLGDDIMEERGFSPFMVNVQTFDPGKMRERIFLRLETMRKKYLINRARSNAAPGQSL